MQAWLVLALAAVAPALAGCVDEPVAERPDRRPLEERFAVEYDSRPGQNVGQGPPTRLFRLRDGTNYCINCDDDSMPRREWVVEGLGLGVVARAHEVDEVEFPFEHATRYTARLHLVEGTHEAVLVQSAWAYWADNAWASFDPGPSRPLEVWSVVATLPGQELTVSGLAWDALLMSPGRGAFHVTGPQGWSQQLAPPADGDEHEWVGFVPDAGTYTVTWQSSDPVGSYVHVFSSARLRMTAQSPIGDA